MNRFPMTRGAALLTALLMAGTLGACNRRDGSQTAGQKVDAAVAKADSEAMDPAAAGVGDTAITASLKADLAADAELTTVGVETRGGRVVLRGMAPDDAASDWATKLAKAVVALDNQLATVR